MNVRDVMTTDVVAVGPDAPLRDVAAILAERRISGLPVVSERGAVLGVVSEADILLTELRARRRPRQPAPAPAGRTRPRAEAKLDAQTAGEAMTSPAITIGPERPLAAAAGMMLERRINRLPVVSGERLVGIVTRADLVRAFARPDGEIVAEIERDVLRRAWIGARVASS